MIIFPSNELIEEICSSIMGQKENYMKKDLLSLFDLILSKNQGERFMRWADKTTFGIFCTAAADEPLFQGVFRIITRDTWVR